MKGKDTSPPLVFAIPFVCGACGGKAPLIARLLQEKRYEITLETVNA
jgi:hypothetical protein